MVPADVDGADLAGLEFGKIGLPETVGSLRARGIRFETTLPDATPAALVSLERRRSATSIAWASRTSTPSRAITAVTCMRAR